jgi:hypothetical protein
VTAPEARRCGSARSHRPGPAHGASFQSPGDRRACPGRSPTRTPSSVARLNSGSTAGGRREQTALPGDGRLLVESRLFHRGPHQHCTVTPWNEVAVRSPHRGRQRRRRQAATPAVDRGRAAPGSGAAPSMSTPPAQQPEASTTCGASITPQRRLHPDFAPRACATRVADAGCEPRAACPRPTSTTRRGEVRDTDSAGAPESPGIAFTRASTPARNPRAFVRPRRKV